MRVSGRPRRSGAAAADVRPGEVERHPPPLGRAAVVLLSLLQGRRPRLAEAPRRVAYSAGMASSIMPESSQRHAQTVVTGASRAEPNPNSAGVGSAAARGVLRPIRDGFDVFSRGGVRRATARVRCDVRGSLLRFLRPNSARVSLAAPGSGKIRGGSCESERGELRADRREVRKVRNFSR